VQKWQELGRYNLRLIDIETYVAGGVRRYAGVWRGGAGGHYLWAGVSWNDFVNKWKELGPKGLRLIDIERYETSAGTKYIGVWHSGTDGYYLWAGADWENFRSKWYQLAQSQLRLVDVEVNQGSCTDTCSNQVVASGPYIYGITRTPTHCPGPPGTCGTPGPNDTVAYEWPVDTTSAGRVARLSALEHGDQFLTLPFRDSAVKGRGSWMYGPGSWHHAADYHSDKGTFIVRAAAPGRVVHVGWDNWSGNTVVVSHDVGGVADAYRTISMHLRDGATNDCNLAWAVTVPWLAPGSTNRTEYVQHLNETGCAQDPAKRNLDAAHWGTNQHTIRVSPGDAVARGAILAWAGNTGPGGKRGGGGPNTHLHIFFARRDPSNNRWYFFDPSGIYGPPQCYPPGVRDPIGGPCARYPIAWLGGRPQHP
jgi:hypothetical protein